MWFAVRKQVVGYGNATIKILVERFIAERICTLKLLERNNTSQTSIPIKVPAFICALSVMTNQRVNFDLNNIFISFPIDGGIIRRFPESQCWSQGNYAMPS